MPADDVDMAYDPDQDQETTRDIRRKYRQRAAQFTDNQDISTEDVAAALREADTLFSEVRAISEATNDSALLLHISNFGAAKARAMKSGSGAFDVDDFVARLITYMGGRKPLSPVGEDEEDASEYDAGGAPLDWERIGRRALAKSKRVPVMDFMCVSLCLRVLCVILWTLYRSRGHFYRLGPLSIEQKKRNIGKRARLEKNQADMKKPQEIHEEDITRSENETTKNVAQLEHILQEMEGESINIFRFIINPNDFGQSVENLFYLSFLIRDGKCAFAIDEESGEPTIMLCEQPTQEDYADGLVKHQMVMEFDMHTWKRAIEVFGITEPMIPQRQKSEMRIGNKWYG
ncbi:hypothetical protein L227DRAFT_587218 [Lentinus tigrinus ALCF2SS1-6]|uniref:Non-structural maintenance of chromosomes element 4 n=1 Tax=Lentinus tigrinus ALCF2SS1-6 TaxID=1328759 RepID=A0A5C2SA80_9APHY|nr:hypothetical protein L227DRAFT_587218 [Lentinus tigrinus ALCF2SS1-6]